MASDHLKIGFVRRGYSSSGGAEAYLKRLAAGVTAAGHEARLISTDEWPAEQWGPGPKSIVAGNSPSTFADAVKRLEVDCDILMSLERIWRCDIYRAGDGVHRAWLERRARLGGKLQKLTATFNRKHQEILRLEKALFAQRDAARVIANSRMVKEEIMRFYDYPSDQIDLVRNGLPLEQFRAAADLRASSRIAMNLAPDDLAVLFVGSGWERKGLRYAIEAVEASRVPSIRLLVAGRGNQSRYRSPTINFLGVVQELPTLYAAADIFLLPTIYDPFSNACLEALASGLPVITTRANGFSEIMQDGTHGSVIDDSANIDALVAALEFWAQRERRDAARPRLLELAAGFDISKNVAETLEIVLRVAR